MGKKNEDTENWLYEDGFDAKKDVLFGKLKELKLLGGPVEKRAAEATARPAAIASLQKNAEKYKKWAADAQANDDLAQNVDPAFYASEVNDKNKGLSNVCNPIVYKPK